MKKVALCLSYHLNNKLFDMKDINTNRDNCNYPMFLLKDSLAKESIDLSTYDINHADKSDFSFYFDYSKPLGFAKKNYLFLFESDVIAPNGWKLDVQKKFDKIFTWKDSLVDNKKFFKINYTHLFPSEAELVEKYIPFYEKKLCTLISGNKIASHPNELYSKRVDIIKWFEKNHLSEFEFYGVGWDRPISKNKYINYIFSKKTILNRFFYNFESYKGSVESKSETLKKYKFTICFENAQMIEGYITEKIFDCFFAGSVPIYWGAPNISTHIPKECYIDFRDFNNYSELYDFIKNIDESTYNIYIESAREFLLSSKSNQFKAKALSDTIIKHIIEDIRDEK
ncbi:glycosyltransferase family 10 domain-containing protein [Photobacterium leiognathi]|uniref:glycosyltransferase family 10 domain-containing protein n=1 Tax=Photobacterium leiognathi TaxID=553611 RepID=UPI0029816BFD|nr:glycosyltransferase family 10 [Photobacterium leiognathi]